MITVCRRVELQCAPASIFVLFTTPARFPALYERAARWDRLSGADMEPGTRYSVVLHAGSVLARSVIEIASVEPPRSITWRSVSGIRQEGRVELRATPRATRVSIGVTITLGSLIVGRLAERYAARILAPRIDAALLALRRSVELGDARA
jgi:hypothetical protein